MSQAPLKVVASFYGEETPATGMMTCWTLVWTCTAYRRMSRKSRTSTPLLHQSSTPVHPSSRYAATKLKTYQMAGHIHHQLRKSRGLQDPPPPRLPELTTVKNNLPMFPEFFAELSMLSSRHCRFSALQLEKKIYQSKQSPKILGFLSGRACVGSWFLWPITRCHPGEVWAEEKVSRGSQSAKWHGPDVMQKSESLLTYACLHHRILLTGQRLLRGWSVKHSYGENPRYSDWNKGPPHSLQKGSAPRWEKLQSS